MITKEKIERINSLAKKKKTMALTEAERVEQQALRAEYLQAVRKNLRGQLDSIIIVDKPQCDKNKGGTEMVENENKRIYENAEESAMKQKEKAGGEDSIYYTAEKAGEKNKTNVHEVMAGSNDGIENEDTSRHNDVSPTKDNPRIYKNAQESAMKHKDEVSGEDLSYYAAEKAGEKNKTNIHEVMAGSNDKA
jgi:uncharacterized protein YnzC (UPF0291/DUF896 family)